LRLDLEAVLRRTVDDLTTPEHRIAMRTRWDEFRRDGVQSGTFEMLMPDGPRLRVDYSATANVQPGRHLAIFVLPATEPDLVAERAKRAKRQHLTDREQEVLGLTSAYNPSWRAFARGSVSVDRITCSDFQGSRNLEVVDVRDVERPDDE
jgi:hypothetical protein